MHGRGRGRGDLEPAGRSGTRSVQNAGRSKETNFSRMIVSARRPRRRASIGGCRLWRASVFHRRSTRRGLRLTFSGREPEACEPLVQLVPLRWRTCHMSLQFRYRTREIPSGAGLGWRSRIRRMERCWRKDQSSFGDVKWKGSCGIRDTGGVPSGEDRVGVPAGSRNYPI